MTAGPLGWTPDGRAALDCSGMGTGSGLVSPHPPLFILVCFASTPLGVDAE